MYYVLFCDSGATNLKLRLSWIDPTDGDNTENDVDLGLVPSLNYDGSECEVPGLVSGFPEAGSDLWFASKFSFFVL